MRLKDMVENCLRDYAPSRDSDKILTFCIWKRYYGITSPVSFADIMKLPMGESVKRARAYIQNDKKMYLPSESCKRKRQAQAKQYKQNNLI